jgi:hypothetical protein
VHTIKVVFRLAAVPLGVWVICVFLTACSSSKQYPTVIVNLPSGLPTEGFVIAYVLYGGFGMDGHRDFVKAGLPSYLIKASAANKSADRILVFIWTPGCKISIFDIVLKNSSGVTRTFSCAELAPVTLSGQIQPVDLLHKMRSEVSVSYSADWLCTQVPLGLVGNGKFASVSCMVWEFSLGRAKVGAKGTFKIELPGLSVGPESSDPGGTLHLLVHDCKTRHFIAALQPESEDWQEAQGLRIALSYPGNLTFVERKFY